MRSRDNLHMIASESSQVSICQVRAMRRSVVPRNSSVHRFASKSESLPIIEDVFLIQYPSQLWHSTEHSFDNVEHSQILYPNPARSGT